MHYLIDGHNLIGKLPDIDLNDPYDEVKLVLKMRRWAAVRRNRRATLYFDGGLPGGVNRGLSAGPVQVIFASPGQTADSLLIGKINEARNPRAYTLVTSDRRVIDAAGQRRMPYLLSEDFAEKLPVDTAATRSPAAPVEPNDDPEISDAEVAEWLDLFGPVPERKPEPPVRSPRRRKRVRKKRPLVTAKEEDRPLDEDEVAAWLELFGDESQPEQEQEKPPPASKDRRSRLKGANETLSDDDLAAWLAAFGEE